MYELVDLNYFQSNPGYNMELSFFDLIKMYPHIYG